MYDNPIYQGNEKYLVQQGYHFLEPASGSLACGWEGKGKLPDPADIFAAVMSVLTPKDLYGCRVLITAGPTREEIDPVRYLSNYSSGKMGYAIAAAAEQRGARVVLVTGPTNLNVPVGVHAITVSSAAQMRDAVLAHFEESDVVIKAAAVADYSIAEPFSQKIKKQADNLTLELKKNPDILAELGHNKGDHILIGFAAETERLMVHAAEKLQKKNLDMIVANDVTRSGAGFNSDTNIVRFLHADGQVEEFEIMTKARVASQLLKRVALLWKAKRQ
jgi:phosphopantothenoylcysteine decarboxylase/phosphopantothenate--cysteine ligase